MRRKFDLTKLRHSRRPSNLPPILLTYLLWPRQLLDGQRDSADRPNSSSQRFWMLRGPNYGLSACHLPIPSRTPCHIPMLEGHRSHPRHSQLSELHSREWDGGLGCFLTSEPTLGKGGNACVSRTKVRNERGLRPRNSRIRTRWKFFLP